MVDNKRSGMMRRQQQIPVSEEHRNDPERRVLLKDSDGTLQRLKNISLFTNLTDIQLREIAGICAKIIYPSQKTIYTIGDESKDMFILMKGKISITFNTGMEVQSISPTGTVGEMGVFTGEPRSASVIADTDCIALVFSKVELFKLFRKDTELWVKILMNTIMTLSQKLRKDNEVIEELMYKVRTLEII